MPLKIAAHLVGFSQFPVGWKWKEWKIIETEKAYCPNFEELTYLNYFDDLETNRQNKAGKTAEQLGRRHRKEIVKAMMLRFLQRNEINAMIQTDNCEWLEPSFKLRNDPLLEFKISRSGIRSENLEWLTYVDSISLFERLEKETSWINKDKDNWFVFERFSRVFIEHNGFEISYDHIIGLFSDWHNNFGLDFGEFDASTAKGKLGKLKREYS